MDFTVKVSARLLAVAVCVLLGWSAWARGGTVVALQGPLPWMGLAILVFLAFERLGISGRRSEQPLAQGRQMEQAMGNVSPSLSRALSGALSTKFATRLVTKCLRGAARARSPLSTVHGSLSTLFWAGLAFLVLLTVQWWNAGRHPYFHPFDQRWVFTPAPHSGWPWAVDRSDAAEMLRWFFPAWALMLALRHARRPAWLATRVAWFLIINAGCLAAFGIAQAISGTQRIFWITPMTDHFFASFGYENHAASYFALLFALAAGMLLHKLDAGQRAQCKGQRSAAFAKATAAREAGYSPPSPPTSHLPPVTAHRQPSRLGRAAIATVSICAVLCLIGMALSFSRVGLVLAMGLSAVTVFVAARLFWQRVSIAQRVAVVATLIMGLSTLFFVVTSMGGVELAQKASQLPHMDVSNELDMRLFMVRSASEMWVGNFWFGVGGWGYRHFLPVYALRETGRKLGLGYANVHNDTMQFLCEFGIVGFGLMLVTTLAFAWPLLRYFRRRLTPTLALAGAGLLVVVCHSVIDLPFRSPAILYAWLAVCGVMNHVGQPKCAGR